MHIKIIQFLKKCRVPIIIFIVLAIPPISSICLFVENILLNYPQRFVSNGNGTWTYFEIPFKDKKLVKGTRFTGSDFKKDFPNATDTVLYRTFDKYWIIPWHWQEYLFDASYQLPYKSIKEIRKNRPADITPYKQYTSAGAVSYVYGDD